MTLTAAFRSAAARGDATGMADAALAVTAKSVFSDAVYIDEQQLAQYEQAIAALAPLGDAEAGRLAQLRARLGAGYSWGQSLQAGLPHATEALAMARRIGDPSTIATVLATVRRALTNATDLELVRGVDAELSALLTAEGDAELTVAASLWRFDTAVLCGEGDELEVLLRQATDAARGMRTATVEHMIAYERASLALLRGRLAEAELLVDRAAQLGREQGLDPTLVQALHLTQKMLVRSEQRRLPEMRGEVEPLFEHAGIPSWRASIGIIDAAAGNHEGVAERIDPVLDDYELRGPTVMCSASVIAFLTPTVLALDDPERSRRVRDLIAPISGQGTALAGFAGPVGYYLGLLERSLGNEAAAQRALARGADFCRRLAAPRWLRRCHQAAALSDQVEPR